MEARRATYLKWWKESLQPRIPYPARLSLRFYGKIKIFSDKQELKEFSTTKPALQELLKDWFFLNCGDSFELWCWRRVLRVPWTARRSNQSILKEISPEYSLEGLMLKLKLWYFGPLMWRTDSLEKTLMLGRIEGQRRRDDRGWDGWMASPT